MPLPSVHGVPSVLWAVPFRVREPLLVQGHAQEPYIKRLPQAVSRHSVLGEPRRGPAMKLSAIALVCLAAAVVTHADPEPHKYHHYPYHYYYPRHHNVEPLEGDGVARHPGGGTSFVAPQVHGLTKRSADSTPEADPQPAADPDPSNSYSYQVVHHGHPRYGYHHGYRYPFNNYRYNNYYGYPHTYHSHHKRSVESEPEPQPHYSYHGRPHYYNRYYHGYPHYYPYYAGYRYRYRG
nr:histidine-rich glycoprotein-like [Penaeus vannamei]